MLHTRAIFATLVAATLLIAAPSYADTNVLGVITDIDLVGTPRQVRVRAEHGGTVVARVANRTHVVFDDAYRHYYPSPDLTHLQPGMRVRFREERDVISSIRVVSVPQDMLPMVKTARPARPGRGHHADVQELAVRIQHIDQRNAELRVDIAGQSVTLEVRDRDLLRGIWNGQMVIVRVRNDQIVELRDAAISGRVVAVRERLREVEIDVQGGVQTYNVENKGLLRRFRAGSSVRFEFEHRPRGYSVITAVR